MTAVGALAAAAAAGWALGAGAGESVGDGAGGRGSDSDSAAGPSSTLFALLDPSASRQPVAVRFPEPLLSPAQVFTFNSGTPAVFHDGLEVSLVVRDVGRDRVRAVAVLNVVNGGTVAGTEVEISATQQIATATGDGAASGWTPLAVRGGPRVTVSGASTTVTALFDANPDAGPMMVTVHPGTAYDSVTFTANPTTP